MRLWQKVFLIALALVLAALNFCGVFICRRYYSSIMTQQAQHLQAQQAQWLGELAAVLQYEKSTADLPTMDDAELLAAAKRQLSELSDGVQGCFLLPNSERGQTDGYQTEFEQAALAAQGENTAVLTLHDENASGRRVLTSAAWFTADGVRCRVLMQKDCTAQLADYLRQLSLIRYIALGVSAAGAVILLLLVMVLLAPQRRADRALQSIAQGNYAVFLAEKGSPENRALAQAINEVAHATQERVEHLESLASERQQFVDALAHEMKTPLTSILCFADLLRIRRVVPDEERVEQAGIIVEEARRLKGLSGKLLELASASRGKLELESTALPELFLQVQSGCAALLAPRSIRLIVSAAKCRVMVDRELFLSVLYNLIDNAQKASKDGATILLQSEYKNRAVTITVADHGIGMTAQQAKHVFEPFYMADKSRSRKSGGAGLGLALCAEIARRHGAAIRVRSVPGKGTAVFLHMPAQPLQSGKGGQSKGGTGE